MCDANTPTYTDHEYINKDFFFSKKNLVSVSLMFLSCQRLIVISIIQCYHFIQPILTILPSSCEPSDFIFISDIIRNGVKFDQDGVPCIIKQ